jgi:hypothetical protein
MSIAGEVISEAESDSVESSAGPSRPISRTSQHPSSSKASSRKGKERASDIDEPELEAEPTEPTKPAKSVRTITTNGGESSEGEDEDDEEEEEEEPYVELIR